MGHPTIPCPGCGLELPATGRTYSRKFHASAECWTLFEEVLAREYQDGVLFGRVHQLTVDAWAVQHAGGRHPDRSVAIHLAGLALVLEAGLAPMEVAPLLQRLARRKSWPRLEPPAAPGELTVASVAAASSAESHARRVREWATAVWRAWGEHHETARRLAEEARRTT